MTDTQFTEFRMTILRKSFQKREDLDAFLASLPPLAFQSVTHGADVVTLKWRPLRLLCLNSCAPGRAYPVVRETESAYLIRNAAGDMISVTRCNMMSAGGYRYEIEEAA
jgi:hypothetical protein